MQERVEKSDPWVVTSRRHVTQTWGDGPHCQFYGVEGGLHRLRVVVVSTSGGGWWGSRPGP